MNLSKLYNSYDILCDAKDISGHQKEYTDAIEATRGGEKEKQLAAQIICKFFKHFPSLQSDAIDAVFDLCEDSDMAIRIAAMKTLPSFCKDDDKYIERVADILGQLLQLEDPQEYNIASGTLLQVLKDAPKLVLKCMFRLINDKETGVVTREKCIKFILSKIKTMERALITQEVEEYLVSQIKTTLLNTTADEFILLMTYLVSSKYAQTLTAQQDLINIIAEQVEMEEKFNPTESECNNTDRLITCVKFVMPFFSVKLESTKFVVYYCDQVLPAWDIIAALPAGNQFQVAIAQQLAELSQHCGTLEKPALQIENIFEKLKVYMPPPPEDSTSTKMPLFNFTMVECLLFAFHRLARQHTEFLTSDQTLLKDFRSRLLYFSRGVQGCLKVINMSGKEKIFSPEEKKDREVAPKLLNNINTLIKDLFYQPPIYKCNVALSFKAEETNVNTNKVAPETVLVGTKRHVPIVYESNGASNNKQGRQTRLSTGDKKIYTPPSGKFSHNFQNNDRGNRFRRGRGGLSRGLRVRGRGNYRN